MLISIVSTQGRDLACSRPRCIGYMQRRAYLITVHKTLVHLIHALEDFGQVVIR
jgi:hypothetical protein